MTEDEINKATERNAATALADAGGPAADAVSDADIFQ